MPNESPQASGKPQEKRKLFVLIAYLLLSAGALFYASLITLNLDFSWKDNVLVAEVPRELEQASLFLDFKTPQVGSLPIKVLSGGRIIHEGPMLLESSSNFRNFLLLRKTQKIENGPLEIQFEKPLDILEVRAEYRYSALRYYWSAIKNGDTKALTLLLIWFAVFGVGISLWKFGLQNKFLLAVFVGHLCFLWMVFTPLSGYDDTYHLPGAALMATTLSRDEIRLQTVKLIKDSHYMPIRRVSREETKRLNEQADFCPHVLSFRDLTVENCPFGDDFNMKIYSSILKAFNLQTVPAVETGLKIINQIVFFLSVMVLGYVFSLLFGLNWAKGFGLVLAGSLSFFPLLPQTMTTGHDLVFFLISSIGLLLSVRIWKSQGYTERAVCFLLSFLLVSPFIAFAQENKKSYLIIVVPVLAMLSLASKLKLRARREFVWTGVAVFLVAPFAWYMWQSMSSFYVTTLYPFLTGNTDYGRFGILSPSRVIELTIDEIIGSVISSKIYPPSPVKAFYLFLLLGLGRAGLKRFFAHEKAAATTMSLLLIGVITVLLTLGGLTLSDVWISLRFAYALAPAFWLLYAAGFLNSRDFDTAPALVAIVAVNTIYLPAFVFPLLN